jgi:Flp pilus assembly protein TadD
MSDPLARARAALDAGHPEEAEAHARGALARRPGDVDALVALATAVEWQGKLPEAIKAWMDAFALEPSRVSSAIGLALAMARHGQGPQAVELVSLALGLHPGDANLHTTRGNLLRALGRYDEARESHQRALALAPSSPAIRANLCSLFLSWGRLDAALVEAEAAVTLAPDSGELRHNLGTCLLRLGRPEDAVRELECAVAANPLQGPAWLNLGEARLECGDEAGAETAFRRAIAVAPEEPSAHFNLALRLLARGAEEEGWREYEWRRRMPDIPLRRLEGPWWDGRRLDGGVLLVTAEQGLGDTFQFVRFLGAAQGRSGARVVFECPAALSGVLEGLAGVDELVPRGSELPRWDAQVSLSSLPGLTGAPLGVSGAYLWAAPARVERWKRRLEPSGLRIAIVWQGNPAYRADARRSIPLSAFVRLARIPGVRLYAVQKEHGRDQLGRWPQEIPLLDLGAELDVEAPFVDTAAVLSAVDLVISSDTAVPHLAGALGQEVWLALPQRADWRWGEAPATTSWYPKFRLFRQERAGQWEPVFAAIERELRDRAEGRR